MLNPKIELRDYLQKLINRLLYIKGINKQLKLLSEWENPNRVVALEIGSYFFRLVSFSFYRTLLIELCLLFDSREERSLIDWLDKALTHSKSLEPMIYNPELDQRIKCPNNDFKITICEHQNLIYEHSTIIKNITGRRDTSLTHSDAHYFNFPEDKYKNFPISTEDLELLIGVATEILKTHYAYLFNADLDIQVHTATNIDRVLRYVRAFDRVWNDERVKPLYPYFYKLDDYEKKVKEIRSNK